MKKIAILASGNGTNAEQMVHHFENHPKATVALILTNRQQAYVLERAKRLGVPAFYFNKEQWSEGHEVLALLRQYEIDFVVLAGFLAYVPQVVLSCYNHRMVNIHPSLLPKFGGKGMYGDRVHEAVIEAGEKESGITIHYTNEHYDEGTIICQERCPVMPDDTPESLATRVHQLEYKYYPMVVERLVCEALTTGTR